MGGHGGPKNNKKKHHIPIFWDLCIFLGCPQYCLTYDVKRVCVFPFSLIEPSSPPWSIKTTQPPQKSNMACRNVLSLVQMVVPVSHYVKPQFMYIGFSWEFPSDGKLKQPTIQRKHHTAMAVAPSSATDKLEPILGKQLTLRSFRVWTLNMALSWKTIYLPEMVIFHSYVTLADRRVWISRLVWIALKTLQWMCQAIMTNVGDMVIRLLMRFLRKLQAPCVAMVNIPLLAMPWRRLTCWWISPTGWMVRFWFGNIP